MTAQDAAPLTVPTRAVGSEVNNVSMPAAAAASATRREQYPPGTDATLTACETIDARRFVLAFHSARNFSPGLSRHAPRMRAGMAADHVPALIQLSNLPIVPKTRRGDPACGYEEIAPPGILFEHGGHRRIGAQAAVVEGEEQLTAGAAGPTDRFQMPRKIVPVHPVNGRPAPGNPLALKSEPSTIS